MATSENVRSIPASWYHDQGVYVREQQCIFARNWIFVGRGENLKEQGHYVTSTIAGQPIVIVYDSTAQSGLAFSRVVDGRVLEFYNNTNEGLELRDRATNSTWEIQGLAIEGSLKGAKLDFVSSFISEWYGWSGYHPETDIYEPGS